MKKLLITISFLISFAFCEQISISKFNTIISVVNDGIELNKKSTLRALKPQVKDLLKAAKADEKSAKIVSFFGSNNEVTTDSCKALSESSNHEISCGDLPIIAIFIQTDEKLILRLWNIDSIQTEVITMVSEEDDEFVFYSLTDENDIELEEDFDSNYTDDRYYKTMILDAYKKLRQKTVKGDF
jgi:hypothetical protein